MPKLKESIMLMKETKKPDQSYAQIKSMNPDRNGNVRISYAGKFGYVPKEDALENAKKYSGLKLSYHGKK